MPASLLQTPPPSNKKKLPPHKCIQEINRVYSEANVERCEEMIAMLQQTKEMLRNCLSSEMARVPDNEIEEYDRHKSHEQLSKEIHDHLLSLKELAKDMVVLMVTGTESGFSSDEEESFGKDGLDFALGFTDIEGVNGDGRAAVGGSDNGDEHALGHSDADDGSDESETGNGSGQAGVA